MYIVHITVNTTYRTIHAVHFKLHTFHTWLCTLHSCWESAPREAIHHTPCTLEPGVTQQLSTLWRADCRLHTVQGRLWVEGKLWRADCGGQTVDCTTYAIYWMICNTYCTDKPTLTLWILVSLMEYLYSNLNVLTNFNGLKTCFCFCSTLYTIHSTLYTLHSTLMWVQSN